MRHNFLIIIMVFPHLISPRNTAHQRTGDCTDGVFFRHNDLTKSKGLMREKNNEEQQQRAPSAVAEKAGDVQKSKGTGKKLEGGSR